MRAVLPALVLPGLLLLAGTAAAAGPSVSDVAAALKNAPVYVDSSAEGASLVDKAALTSAIGSSDIKIAVLPAALLPSNTAAASEAAADSLSEAIGDRNAVTITLIGKHLDAAAGPGTGAPAGGAEALAKQAFEDHSSGGFTAANVEGALVELVQSTKSDLADSSRSTGGTGAVTPTAQPKKSHTGAYVFLVLIIVLLGVGGFFLFRSRKRKKQAAAQQFAAAKAEVDGLYSRLANDVTTINPADNTTAQQAMSDASERYNTAGAGLSGATSLGALAAVRRTVIEGIEASRTARKALGLDPGPDPAPAPPANAQPLIGNGQYVNVGQQSYQGYGNYQPGNPYYFGGGYYNGGYVPGGWYGTPFWEQLLITEAVFGGFGGWGFGGGGYGYGYGGGYGGGYDQGYGSGYNQGYDQGLDQNQGGGGGDWGANAGGGDWGGGGGDFGGGSGGGGDWGGGGGDFGGGGGGDWGGGGGDFGGGGGGDGGGGGW